MRVIGGKFKGKRLAVSEGRNVRPTTDRVKETIFNILASMGATENSAVLDLFCGSGALGIEALSRGARGVIFVDKNPESVRFTKQNLSKVGVRIAARSGGAVSDIAGEAEVFNTSFEVAVKKLGGRKFDLIFLDPPYFENIEARCLSLIEDYNLLAESGVIVLEHSSKIDMSWVRESYIMDTRDFGSMSASFLTKRISESGAVVDVMSDRD